MKTIWYIVIIITALCVLLLIPFSIFFYETDEDQDAGKRMCAAFQFTMCSFVSAGLIIFILYMMYSKADIPVTACSRGISTRSSSTAAIAAAASAAPQKCQDIDLEIEVSFIIFMIATVIFLGMFLFVIFGGVGLFAMPLDLIHAYTRRP